MLIRILAVLVPVALVAVLLGMLYVGVTGHISDSQPDVSNTSVCTSDTFLGVCLDGTSGR